MKRILIILLAFALLFGCTGITGNNDSFYVIGDDVNDVNIALYYVPYTGATADVVLGLHDLNAYNINASEFLTTAFFCDRFGVGCIDMTGDPWALMGISFWIDGNLDVDGNYICDGEDCYLIGGFVPYIGATQDLNLGLYNLDANNINIGTPAGTDPSITFLSEGGDGLMWWEDVGDRFNFDHGITVDGTVLTDELLTKSIRWATGDYLIFNPTDNNWQFLINNIPVFEIESDGNTWIAGDLNVDGNARAECYFLSDGNYFCDLEDITAGISLDEYVPYVGATSDVNIGFNNLEVNGNILGNSIYGGLNYHSDVGASIVFGTQYEPYTFMGGTCGLLNGFNCNGAAGTLTAVYDGVYRINFDAAGIGNNNHVYHGNVFINDVNQVNTITHVQYDSGTVATMVNSGTFIRVNADDVLTLKISDHSGISTGTVYSWRFNVVRIGN